MSKENSSKKFGNYIITNPGSVKLIADKFLEEGKAIHIENENTVVMNSKDYAKVILEMAEGDYLVLFTTMGLNDESIDAACEYARKKVDAVIEAAYQKAIEKFK